MRPGRTIGLCWNVGTWIMEGTQLIALSMGCPAMKNHSGFWALIIFPQPRSWYKLWMTSCIRWNIGDRDREEILFTGSLSSVQLLSRVWLFVTPWTAAHKSSLSITNFQSLLKFMAIDLVMPSNHLILYCPLLLLPSIFPSIRVFSNESVLRIRWPKYWRFSFSIRQSVP